MEEVLPGAHAPDQRRDEEYPDMATNTAVNNAPAIDPMHTEQVGHGNSVAAWTAVGIMLVGSLVACIGFTVASVPVFAAGLGVIALGLVAGGIMKAAGYGVGGSKSKDH
jgi:hypothetical protein